MIIHYKLPENGAYKAQYESEFYSLIGRKRVMYEDNRTLHIGLRYLIWSRYSRCYYERFITEHDDPEDFRYYQELGWLWLFPTEENKEAIREDVKSSGMGYYALMKKRQLEIDHERHEKYGNRGDGYKTRIKMYRKLRYNK